MDFRLLSISDTVEYERMLEQELHWQDVSRELVELKVAPERYLIYKNDPNYSGHSLSQPPNMHKLVQSKLERFVPGITAAHIHRIASWIEATPKQFFLDLRSVCQERARYLVRARSRNASCDIRIAEAYEPFTRNVPSMRMFVFIQSPFQYHMYISANPLYLIRRAMVPTAPRFKGKSIALHAFALRSTGNKVFLSHPLESMTTEFTKYGIPVEEVTSNDLTPNAISRKFPCWIVTSKKDSVTVVRASRPLFAVLKAALSAQELHYW